ncbi:30S ribosomal protein S2 [Candidatus Woesearchaeota archaeon]|nr:30S ribosomal protein S2 [Candidatus Woesearchaeota archaeon]
MVEENKELLIAQDEYLKSGIHIGTKFKTKYMEPFIYKTRPDGLSVLNLQLIDERLRFMINLVQNYPPEDIIVVSRRENSWKAVKAFGRATGIRVFPGRYPPGILTNSQLKTFIEARLMIVTDAWPDRNAVLDALQVGIPVIALCDTNNTANTVDYVMPCNNKGKKSLGILFFLLAKYYLLKRGVSMDIPMDDFMEE